MIALIFAVPLALFAVYFVFSGFKYTRMISHIFMSLVYKPEPDEFPRTIPTEPLTILDSSDHEIHALTAGPKSARRVVIFCHESGATKESWEKYAGFLAESGSAVIAMDLGPGEAAEGTNQLSQWPAESEVERIVTVIRYAKRVYGPGAAIVLFGVSNGADLALGASVRDASVTAVVTDGLFSMREIFRDYIRKWAPILVRPNLFGQKYPEWIVRLFADLGFWYSQRTSGKRFVDVERLMRRPHPRLLLVYGELDDYVPASHQNYLGRLVRSKKDTALFVVEKAKHNEAVMVEPRRYQESILEFLEAGTR